MATPVCTIDANGITRPSFATVLAYVQDQFRAIYGSDVYIEPDSQDGQFLALLAAAINDNNAQCVAAYNSFSPGAAQGVGLSSLVKINGIQRRVPSYSTVDLKLIGQAGTVINDGYAVGADSNQWLLPPRVVIPITGLAIFTATAANAGAITAPAASITTIGTPTAGWQSVNNVNAATPGLPIEQDADLRIRQSVSTRIPSRNTVEGIIAEIASLPDVTSYRVYENDGWTTDSNSIPPHSIACVVEGGDASAIASAIFRRKTAGSSTYGATQQTVFDSYGIPHQIAFFRPTLVPITYQLTLKVFSNFTSDIQAQIAAALNSWTNNLGTGNSLLLNRANVPANLYGNPASSTYEIVSFNVARGADTPSPNDVSIAYFEKPNFLNATIALTV